MVELKELQGKKVKIVLKTKNNSGNNFVYEGLCLSVGETHLVMRDKYNIQRFLVKENILEGEVLE